MIKGKKWISTQNMTKYKIRELSNTSSCNTNTVMKLAGGQINIFFTYCIVKISYFFYIEC